MLGFYWTFIIFAVMWAGIIFGYRGVLRVLSQREAEKEGEGSWTIGV